jgi:hypothetical protein
MSPEGDLIRERSRDLPPFSRLVAGVPEETLDQMMKNIKLQVAADGLDWTSEEKCNRMSEQFSDYEPYEIAALAKRLQLDKDTKPTHH